MRNKKVCNYVALVFLFFLNCAHAAEDTNSIWVNSPVGSCSQSNSEPQKDTDDESLVTHLEPTKGIHGERYTWYWNNTPSRNPTRTLTMEDGKGKSCAILFLPTSDSYSFKMKKNGDLPLIVKSKTSPYSNSDGSYEVIELTYALNKSTGFYGKYPSSCNKIINNKVSKKIDCLKAFD